MSDDEIDDTPEPEAPRRGRPPKPKLPDEVPKEAGEGEVRVEIIRAGGSGSVHDGRGNKYERGDRVSVPADVALVWIEKHWAEKI